MNILLQFEKFLPNLNVKKNASKSVKEKAVFTYQRGGLGGGKISTIENRLIYASKYFYFQRNRLFVKVQGQLRASLAQIKFFSVTKVYYKMKQLDQKRVVKKEQRVEGRLWSYKFRRQEKKQRFDFGKWQSKEEKKRIERLRRVHHYYCVLSQRRGIMKHLKKNKMVQLRTHENAERENYGQEKIDFPTQKELSFIQQIQEESKTQNFMSEDNSIQHSLPANIKLSEQFQLPNKFPEKILNQGIPGEGERKWARKRRGVRRDPIEVSEQEWESMYSEAKFGRRISSRVLKKELLKMKSIEELITKLIQRHPQLQLQDLQESLSCLEKYQKT